MTLYKINAAIGGGSLILPLDLIEAITLGPDLLSSAPKRNAQIFLKGRQAIEYGITLEEYQKLDQAWTKFQELQ